LGETGAGAHDDAHENSASPARAGVVVAGDACTDLAAAAGVAAVGIGVIFVAVGGCSGPSRYSRTPSLAASASGVVTGVACIDPERRGSSRGSLSASLPRARVRGRLDGGGSISQASGGRATFILLGGESLDWDGGG